MSPVTLCKLCTSWYSWAPSVFNSKTNPMCTAELNNSVSTVQVHYLHYHFVPCNCVCVRMNFTRNFLSLSIGWEKGGQVEPEIYWLFMFQLGFYLHFLYATVFVNTKRKDFAVLVLHHVLTITLIAWSYAVR